jgi:acyl-CoA synthetase (AMP-forming)/AMP-acid ligase II
LGWLNPRRLVKAAFRLRPGSEYIVFKDQRLTRRQVFARLQALAAGLQALGIGPGQRVATLLPGCPEAVYAALLPSVLGNVNVPLNPLLGEHELRHILADAGAEAVITTENWYGLDHAATLARLQPHLPDLRHVVVCGAEAGGGGTFLSLDEVTAMGTTLRPIRISADDPVLISYTSGTTGLPKGVVHTHQRYWGLAVRAVNPRLDMQLLRCLVLPFPPYHYAGLLGIVATLLAGGRVVLMDRFDPRRVLSAVETERASQIAGSPTMFRWLLRTPGQGQHDLSSLRRITLSTEPCPPELARALDERTGCHLENMYGTTESMVISWTGPEDSWERVATTVGRPVPGAEVRIVDPEDRHSPLPAGERGEIATRTSQMMTGYHGDEGLTAQVLDADGWFYTGDSGYVGEDGYLRVLGRTRELIIRGGEKVYPKEVERYLERHPLVRHAAVIGLSSPVSGQTVWAYLEAPDGTRPTVAEVLDFCRGRIAPHKIPEQVRFVERLPRTATNKVQTYRLHQMAFQEVGDDAAI